MNVENLNKLINFLETEVRDPQTADEASVSEGVFFKMSDWRVDHSCGTFVCLGGATEILFASNPDDHIFPGEAAKIYDMTEYQMNQLFYPTVADMHDFGTTRTEAVQMLKNIRDGHVVFNGEGWIRVLEAAA